MAIYKRSRYEGTYLFQDPETNHIFVDPIREPKFSEEREDFYRQIRAGDRLDIIAKEMYGDERLEWILVDANPQYTSPLEIKEGDYIVIPNPQRVKEHGY